MLIHSAATIRRSRPSVAASSPSYPVYSYQSLEIYAPRPSLDTTNRYYKAYPDPTGSLGIPYNVKVAVVGGAWPYTYALTTAPSGMTINSATGEINWPQPTATGSPHSVTMQVTDNEGTQASVSWTVTVTTSGFYFLDRVNGNPSDQNGGTATGDINDPWQTLLDVYGTTKAQARNPGAFIYFKTGVYELNTIVENSLGEHRSPWTENKSTVWMAYPGQSPEIRYNYGGYDHRIQFYGSAADNPDVYVEGIEFNDNGAYRGIVLAVSGGTRCILRDLYIHGATQTPIDNHSGLFLTGGSGQYSAVMDITIDGCPNHYGVLHYGFDKILFDNVNATGGPTAMSPKDGNSYFTVRNCFLKGSTHGFFTQTYVGQGYTQYCEIHHNYIECTNSSTDFYTYWGYLSNHNDNDPHGPYWVYRNTIKGNIVVQNLKAGSGAETFVDNLLLTGTGGADGIVDLYTVDITKLVTSGNIIDVYASALIDASGNLTGDGLQYLGLKGWELE